MLKGKQKIVINVKRVKGFSMRIINRGQTFLYDLIIAVGTQEIVDGLIDRRAKKPEAILMFHSFKRSFHIVAKKFFGILRIVLIDCFHDESLVSRTVLVIRMPFYIEYQAFGIKSS